MPETQFPSMKATQNKSDVTSGFGDRDLILAVCTCFFLLNVAVSKLFAIFVRLRMAEIHFRSMEASQKKCDVTIQFLVGGLVIHFAGIFHLSFSVETLFKNFMLVQW
jgi:hypothetical protein